MTLCEHDERFLESELEPVAPQDARFHIIPAGFEASVSYGGGTRRGPAGILKASQQLEVWDGLSNSSRLGLFTHCPVDCDEDATIVLERIEVAVQAALDVSAENPPVPVLLGGEHTVTLGALRALHKRFGKFGVVQFDAHADLRDEYEGSPYSHASVMHRALDLGLPLVQVGVRACCEAEVAVRGKYGVIHWDARDLARNGLPQSILPPDFPENVYVTFDVDGLDPSVIRATGTPVPGGTSWWDAQHMLEQAMRGRRVLGMDVVELAPDLGDIASDFAAAQLVYNMMGMVQRLAK
ncbi:agmatinase [Oleidesulfovibrio sp.]|uniref:agmatinase n=1 Tax=Oleidesulfovibrio sp. TaxID=2909707 RepID=UPI003A8890E0